MAPLVHKLSSLEVELLNIVEYAPESEQERDLDALTSHTEITILSTVKGNLPINGSKCCYCDCCCCKDSCCDNDSCCCCCCC
jgi:hypothetical protein